MLAPWHVYRLPRHACLALRAPGDPATQLHLRDRSQHEHARRQLPGASHRARAAHDGRIRLRAMERQGAADARVVSELTAEKKGSSRTLGLALTSSGDGR